MAVTESTTKIQATILLNGGIDSGGKQVIKTTTLGQTIDPAKYDAEKLYNIYNSTNRIFPHALYGCRAVKTQTLSKTN